VAAAALGKSVSRTHAHLAEEDEVARVVQGDAQEPARCREEMGNRSDSGEKQLTAARVDRARVQTRPTNVRRRPPQVDCRIGKARLRQQRLLSGKLRRTRAESRRPEKRRLALRRLLTLALRAISSLRRCSRGSLQELVTKGAQL